MKARYLASLAILSVVAFLAAWRHHIRDLYEIGGTYSVFHSYIRHNPDVLFRYPSSKDETRDIALDEHVPKIIHQIFLSQGHPYASLSKYEPAIASCKSLHPSWHFNLWTDEEGRKFMQELYPELYPHYLNYKQNIQRANILRYAVLEHFGGVYLDLDVTCRVALDAQLGEQGSSVPTLMRLPWLTPGAYPAGVNNAFILSRPRHPFLGELLKRAPSRDLAWGLPYVENMLSTGCGFFGNVWMVFALRLEREWANPGVRKEDRVYVLANEKGEMEPHMLRGKIVTPLFEHGGASSWHGWDAAALVMIGKHYGYFALGLALISSLIIFGVRKLVRRTKKTQPRRRSSRRGISGAIARFSLDRRSMDKHGLEDEEQGLMKDG